MGLLGILPDLGPVGGGGGAGLGFCILLRSLKDECSTCLFLRALHSSPAAPKAGSTLAFSSSACRALVFEFSCPAKPGLLITLGVDACGLDPGLGSVSLPRKEEQISGDVLRRGGGVRVPIRRAFSPFCSLVLFRGRAGFPSKVLESKWRWPRSRGRVTDFHSVPSRPFDMMGDQRKRFELEKPSSSLGGVVATLFPGPGNAWGPFLRGYRGPG